MEPVMFVPLTKETDGMRSAGIWLRTQRSGRNIVPGYPRTTAAFHAAYIEDSLVVLVPDFVRNISAPARRYMN